MAFNKRYTGLYLLILFCWYFSSINLNIHTHITDMGEITHSHPGANEGHSHNTAQFNLIKHLVNFQTGDPASLSDRWEILIFNPIIICEIQEKWQISKLCHKILTRGPPAAIKEL